MSQQRGSSRNRRRATGRPSDGNGKCKQSVSALYSARLPTIYGEFDVTVYHDDEGKEHLALRMGTIESSPALVRIHSECLTGEVFGSVRCDCREQLVAAFRCIAEEGRGILVYLRQEGRGIGLTAKVHAYSLQDKGLDTVDANIHLGFPADSRSFAIAASILRDQGARQVRLLTNNPQKIADLEAGDIEVVERVPNHIPPRPENLRYLKTKAEKLGHLFGDATARSLP